MDIQLALKLTECPAPTYPLSSNSLMLKTLYVKDENAVHKISDFGFDDGDVHESSFPLVNKPPQ